MQILLREYFNDKVYIYLFTFFFMFQLCGTKNKMVKYIEMSICHIPPCGKCRILACADHDVSVECHEKEIYSVIAVIML